MSNNIHDPHDHGHTFQDSHTGAYQLKGIVRSITPKSHLIWGIFFKDSNTGAIHTKVTSQHCRIQVPSHNTPLDPNNQRHTFQDSYTGEVHIKVILHHDRIQVPFQEIPSKPLSIWDRPP